MASTAQQAQQTDPQPKRTAILEAALDRFAELGVNGVAVPDIARRAQVGTGTIYRYFENKEALVNVLFQEEKVRFGNYLSETAVNHDAPREQFNDYWRRMIGFAREYPKAFRFLELQDHLPYLDEESRELEREVLRRLASPTRSLQQQGVFRNDIRAEIIMATVWGAFVNLMKAERAGYFELSDKDITDARDACWRMCTP
ncbi:TetR/AcrR family transcriptional regulator [Marinobacter lacisalsi]|uniref:TetR/AcrR family transcriptional regulator n=1 Tax=Marinobacter lacisalsi TaxID=475979 RepID=A0ABV8QN26_9GAMM